MIRAASSNSSRRDGLGNGRKLPPPPARFLPFPRPSERDQENQDSSNQPGPLTVLTSQQTQARVSNFLGSPHIAGIYGHHHQGAIIPKKEELSAVGRPPRILATSHRGLLPRARIWGQVYLSRSGAIRVVGDKAAVWGKGRTFIVCRRCHKSNNLSIRLEHEDVPICTKGNGACRRHGLGELHLSTFQDSFET